MSLQDMLAAESDIGNTQKYRSVPYAHFNPNANRLDVLGEDTAMFLGSKVVYFWSGEPMNPRVIVAGMLEGKERHTIDAEGTYFSTVKPIDARLQSWIDSLICDRLLQKYEIIISKDRITHW